MLVVILLDELFLCRADGRSRLPSWSQHCSQAAAVENTSAAKSGRCRNRKRIPHGCRLLARTTARPRCTGDAKARITATSRPAATGPNSSSGVQQSFAQNGSLGCGGYAILPADSGTKTNHAARGSCVWLRSCDVASCNNRWRLELFARQNCCWGDGCRHKPSRRIPR